MSLYKLLVSSFMWNWTLLLLDILIFRVAPAYTYIHACIYMSMYITYTHTCVVKACCLSSKRLLQFHIWNTVGYPEVSPVVSSASRAFYINGTREFATCLPLENVPFAISMEKVVSALALVMVALSMGTVNSHRTLLPVILPRIIVTRWQCNVEKDMRHSEHWWDTNIYLPR